MRYTDLLCLETGFFSIIREQLNSVFYRYIMMTQIDELQCFTDMSNWITKHQASLLEQGDMHA